MQNRNRIEYRLRNSRRDSVCYRNRIRLDIPVTKDKKEIFTLFISTEPFYDFQADKWTRNEFFAGIGKKFSSTFSAEIFYPLAKNGNLLNTINGSGISLIFRIDGRLGKEKISR